MAVLDTERFGQRRRPDRGEQKLRTENRELTEQANGLAARTHELAKNLAAAAEEIAKYRARFFGRSSENLSLEEQQQMGLFDEADQAVAPQEQEAQAAG